MGAFWLIGQVCLFILGCWWCKEIFGRLRTDIKEVTEPKQPGERWVVIFFWAITACIMAVMGYFVYGLAAPLAGAIF